MSIVLRDGRNDTPRANTGANLAQRQGAFMRGWNRALQPNYDRTAFTFGDSEITWGATGEFYGYTRGDIPENERRTLFWHCYAHWLTGPRGQEMLAVCSEDERAEISRRVSENLNQ